MKTGPDRDADDERPVSLWQTITSVLAAFFGVQSSRNRARDFARGNPFAFFIVALALTGVFVMIVLGVVRLILGQEPPVPASTRNQPIAVGVRETPAASAEPLDTLARRVLPCAACHGEQGRATPDGYYPRIAGKPAGYLFNQLVNFREGRRSHDVMRYLLDRQRDGYLREMAQHFADLRPPYPPPAPVQASPQQLERGRALVRAGDAALDIPACADCHGERLTGVAPAIPGLIGLPRDYLVAQFGAWQVGARRAQSPDCMAGIARRLSPADVAAVTAWLATQPVPGDASPAVVPARALPLKCGGVSAESPS